MRRPESGVIALVGPECTGKTTLSKQLSKCLGGQLVSEYARTFLSEHGEEYTKEDLPLIAKGQLNAEQEALTLERRPIICDTDLLVIIVWHEYKYGQRNTQLEELFQNQHPRSYLLTAPDLPWVPDPLRENPYDRQEIFQHYEEVLNRMDLPYSIIRGKGEERLSCALNALNVVQ